VRIASGLRDVARPQLRPRTFEIYGRCADRHIVPAIGGKRLNALTPAGVRKVLNDKTTAGLAPRTVSYIRAVLRSALSQAVRDGLSQRNVSALAKPCAFRARRSRRCRRMKRTSSSRPLGATGCGWSGSSLWAWVCGV